jgi:hypothetical protein
MNTEELHKKGCLFVPSFLDKQTTMTISSYIQNKAKRASFVPEGIDRTNSNYYWYADPLLEILLDNNTSTVEKISGKSLYPTYSYTRIYSEKDMLQKHVDRDECQYSVSVHIAKTGNDSPFYIENYFGETEEHILSPGDAIVYIGNKCLHWRKPLAQTNTLLNTQVMLHYVDKHGDHSELRFDGRKELGLSKAKLNWV